MNLRRFFKQDNLFEKKQDESMLNVSILSDKLDMNIVQIQIKLNAYQQPFVEYYVQWTIDSYNRVVKKTF